VEHPGGDLPLDRYAVGAMLLQDGQLLEPEAEELLHAIVEHRYVREVLCPRYGRLAAQADTDQRMRTRDRIVSYIFETVPPPPLQSGARTVRRKRVRRGHRRWQAEEHPELTIEVFAAVRALLGLVYK